MSVFQEGLQRPEVRGESCVLLLVESGIQRSVRSSQMTSSSFDSSPLFPQYPLTGWGGGGGAALGRGLTQAQLQGPEEEVVRRKNSVGHRSPWSWKRPGEVRESLPGSLPMAWFGEAPTLRA